MPSIGLLLLALAVGLRLPTKALPPTALVMWMVLPGQYLDLSSWSTRYAPPYLVILVLWAARSGLRSAGAPKLTPATVLCLTAVALCALTSAFSSSLGRSPQLLWTVTFTLGAWIAAAAVGRGRMVERDLLLKVWMWAAVIEATYCIVERGVEANPYASFTTSGVRGIPFVQHWSVYRSTGTFGHPLNASTFFAVTAIVFLFSRLPARRAILISGLSVAGLLTTASRSGIIAMAVAGALGAVLYVIKPGRRSVRVLAVGAVATGSTVAVGVSSLLAGRPQTAEANQSTLVRSRLAGYAWQFVAENPLLGLGPGRASSAFDRLGTKLPLENSLMQVLVGMGWIGATVTALFFLIVVRQGSTFQDPAGGLGAAAFIVSIAGYTYLDSQPGALAIVALVLLSSHAHVGDEDVSSGASVAPPAATLVQPGLRVGAQRSRTSSHVGRAAVGFRVH